MKKVLLLIAGATFFVAAPAQAHKMRHHVPHHDYHRLEKRYFTCHNHPRRGVRHCHGHTNWKHGRRVRQQEYYYTPSIIFDF